MKRSILLLVLVLTACGDDDGVSNDNNTNQNANTAICGNGTIEPGEQCDSGASNSDAEPDTCRTDCRLPYCGDGVADQGEACDDGNDANDDACLTACGTGEPCCQPNTCGDGFVNADLDPGTGEPYEICDDGDPAGGSCSPDCQASTAACGDGVVDPGEECDTAGSNSDLVPNACRTDCRAAHCGDGVVDTGEGCDDGNASDADACPSACTGSQPCCAVAACNDGMVNHDLDPGTGQPYEVCDDGDPEGGTCRDDCQQDFTQCGNDSLDPGEACDDGDAVGGDGCSATCQVESGWYCTGLPSVCVTDCGDGIRAGTEACDGLDFGADDCTTLGGEGGIPVCRADCSADTTGCWTCGDGLCTANEDGHCAAECELVSIAAGSVHTCAARADGTVWCWGKNGYGQLGDGTTTDRLTPVRVAGIDDAQVVEASNTGTCSLHTGGTVSCWGGGSAGTLGDGQVTHDTCGVSDCSREPVAVINLPAPVVQLSMGGGHVCARLDTGRIRCWGYNSDGKLGDGTSTNRFAPVEVSGITNASQVGALGGHTCATLSTGAALCWGRNVEGQLGTGNNTSSMTPVAVSATALGGTVIAWAGGTYHTCALLQVGTLKCWGMGNAGQLGNGGNTSQNAPVTVSGNLVGAAVAAGGDASCAITTAQDAYCWGVGDYGALGNGSMTDASTPQAVLGGLDLERLAGGNQHICGLTTAGDAWCWGRADSGQLGVDPLPTSTCTDSINPFFCSPEPVPVQGL